jgi:hypothetical protein
MAIDFAPLIMKKILWVLLGLALALAAQAEIYKYIDADGRVTYSNVPTKGAVKLSIESPPPPNSTDVEKAAIEAPLPSDIQKAEQDKQKQLVAQRRTILEEELAKERQALEEAQAFHEEAKKDPEVFLRVVGEDEKPVLGGKEGPLIIEGGKIVIGKDGPVHQLMKEDGTLVFDTNDGKQVPVPYEKPIPGYKEGPPIIENGKPVLGPDGNPVHQLMKEADGTLVYTKSPLPIKRKRGRNMAWYAKKLNQLEEEIKTHEDNIELLEKELSRR